LIEFHIKLREVVNGIACRQGKQHGSAKGKQAFHGDKVMGVQATNLGHLPLAWVGLSHIGPMGVRMAFWPLHLRAWWEDVQDAATIASMASSRKTEVMVRSVFMGL